MTNPRPLSQGQKSALEFGPILVFLALIYGGQYFGLTKSADRFYWATLALVPLAVISLIYIWWRERETPWILLVSTLFLVGFGSLTIATGGDAVWLKIKLTVVSLIYAAGLGITWLIGFPLLKKLFGKTIVGDDAAWIRAAGLMAIGSLISAGVNEILWLMWWQTPETWAFFGKIGLAVLQAIFTMIALFPLIQQTAKNTDQT